MGKLTEYSQGLENHFDATQQQYNLPLLEDWPQHELFAVKHLAKYLILMSTHADTLNALIEEMQHNLNGAHFLGRM